RPRSPTLFPYTTLFRSCPKGQSQTQAIDSGGLSALEQAMQDLDPVETQEWLDALESVIDKEGEDRAHYLMTRMGELATRSGSQRSEEHTSELQSRENLV